MKISLSRLLSPLFLQPRASVELSEQIAALQFVDLPAAAMPKEPGRRHDSVVAGAGGAQPTTPTTPTRGGDGAQASELAVPHLPVASSADSEAPDSVYRTRAGAVHSFSSRALQAVAKQGALEQVIAQQAPQADLPRTLKLRQVNGNMVVDRGSLRENLVPGVADMVRVIFDYGCRAATVQSMLQQAHLQPFAEQACSYLLEQIIAIRFAARRGQQHGLWSDMALLWARSIVAGGFGHIETPCSARCLRIAAHYCDDEIFLSLSQRSSFLNCYVQRWEVSILAESVPSPSPTLPLPEVCNYFLAWQDRLVACPDLQPCAERIVRRLGSGLHTATWQLSPMLRRRAIAACVPAFVSRQQQDLLVTFLTAAIGSPSEHADEYRYHASLAVQQGDSALLQALLDAGLDAQALVDPEASYVQSLQPASAPQTSLLHLASVQQGPSQARKREVVQLLLTAGAQPQVCTPVAVCLPGHALRTYVPASTQLTAAMGGDENLAIRLRTLSEHHYEQNVAALRQEVAGWRQDSIAALSTQLPGATAPWLLAVQALLETCTRLHARSGAFEQSEALLLAAEALVAMTTLERRAVRQLSQAAEAQRAARRRAQLGVVDTHLQLFVEELDTRPNHGRKRLEARRWQQVQQVQNMLLRSDAAAAHNRLRLGLSPIAILAAQQDDAGVRIYLESSPRHNLADLALGLGQALSAAGPPQETAVANASERSIVLALAQHVHTLQDACVLLDTALRLQSLWGLQALQQGLAGRTDIDCNQLPPQQAYKLIKHAVLTSAPCLQEILRLVSRPALRQQCILWADAYGDNLLHLAVRQGDATTRLLLNALPPQHEALHALNISRRTAAQEGARHLSPEVLQQFASLMRHDVATPSPDDSAEEEVAEELPPSPGVARAAVMAPVLPMPRILGPAELCLEALHTASSATQRERLVEPFLQATAASARAEQRLSPTQQQGYNTLAWRVVHLLHDKSGGRAFGFHYSRAHHRKTPREALVQRVRTEALASESASAFGDGDGLALLRLRQRARVMAEAYLGVDEQQDYVVELFDPTLSGRGVRLQADGSIEDVLDMQTVRFVFRRNPQTTELLLITAYPLL